MFSITAKSQSPEWEDLSVFKVNTTAPHAHFKLYKSKNEKEKADASSLEVSLNGRWDFKLYSTPKETPKDFFKTNLIVLTGAQYLFQPIGSSTQSIFHYTATSFIPTKSIHPLCPKTITQWGAIPNVYDSRKLE
ncbi:MAG: hypothetical protein CM15mP32_5230 [Flavobacteriaceae bacterium]|nr:MAG: hypothetical protein CM15mP32_5230 [Flavobacteriaceae bacterium]